MNFKEYLEYSLPMAGKDKIVVLSTTDGHDIIIDNYTVTIEEDFIQISKKAMDDTIHMLTTIPIHKIMKVDVIDKEEFDKFKEMRLTKQKANFVKCPLIKESPASIECKVKEIKELGSHHMFIAEVLSIDADEKYIDENGAFDISKCDLISYANGGYYSQGKKLGKFGYSVKKK